MPETREKLETYLGLLRKWQKSINLVSAGTLDDAWQRHFEDSLQLAAFVPEGARIADLGSGAGFPGLVLAIARPDLDVTLIESDTKKCTFLSTVSRETSTRITVINKRIESVTLDSVPAIVTARALAALDKLLGYCLRWAEENPGLTLLFLKGEKMDEEIAAARAVYAFDAETFPSQTSKEGGILQIRNLRRKTES